MEHFPSKQLLSWSAIIILAIAVFTIDLMIPLGVAGGVPYVIVVLASLWLPRRRDTILVAVACTVLTFLGWWFSPSGGELWKVASNRGLSVFAILATAVLTCQYGMSLETKFRSLAKDTIVVTSLPMKGFAVSLLLTASVFMGLGVQAWWSFRATEAHLVCDGRLLQLSGDMGRLDEALTMSVHMAAATGDDRWEGRYRGLESQFAAVREEAMRLVFELNMYDVMDQIRGANNELIVLEEAAFGKIRLGRFDDAKTLLASEVYRRGKREYAGVVVELVAAIEYEMDIARQNQRVHTLAAMVALGVVMPVLLCAWVYTLGTLRRHLTQRRHAESALREGEKCLRSQFAELELLYSSAPVGLCLVDTDLRFVRVNQRLAAINNRPASGHIGLHLSEVLPKLVKFVEPIFRRVIETGQPECDLEVHGPTPGKCDDQRDWLTGYYPLKDDAGKVVGVSVMVQDITERKRDVQALRDRVAFENLIANLSTKFINLKPLEIDGGINEALGTIASFAGVDRSYIFQFSADRKNISNSYEWCEEGIVAHKDELQDLSVDAFPWIMPQYLKGELIHIPSVADLPAEAAAEKEEFQREAIQSLVGVPLVLGGKVNGFVGFDSVRSEKSWSYEIISLLRIVGEMFANAIARKEADKALRQAHQDLGKRVGQRTRELADANEELKREIADRRRAQEALCISESRFRKIFDHSNDAIFVIDPACDEIVDVNQTACKILGYSREKLLSMTISDIHPNDITAIQAVGESVLVQGSGRIEECQCRMQNGQDIACELSASVIDVAGKRCMLALVRNITERKRAEQSLRLVAEGTSSVVGSDFFASLVCNLAQSLGVQYAFVMEHGPTPVRTARVLASWLDRRYGEKLEYNVAGTPCQDTVNGIPTFYPSNIQTLFPEDELLRDLDVQSYCGIPLFSVDGWVVGHLVVMDDKPVQQNLCELPVMRIFAARASAELERNRVEQALVDNESRYRALYEDNPSMYFTVDAQGIVLSVNRFGADQLGYTPQQLVGRSVLDIVYETDRQIVREHLAKCMKNPGKLHGWEFRKIRQDGSILWVHETGRSVPGNDNGDAVVLIVCEDITNQKQADELMRIQTKVLEMTAKGVEMAQTLNTLCHFIEQMVSDGICSVMLVDGRTGSLRFEAGPNVSEAYGVAVDGLMPAENAASCGTAAYLGEPVYVADTLVDPRWSDFRDFAIRFGIRGCWSVPIFVDSDIAVGSFAISLSNPGGPDAFQRQVLETASRLASIVLGRQRAKEQMQQHQEELAHVTRLSTVGELASGLAHEINQPLAAISNYVQACAGELRSGHWDQKELVGTMAKASSQCHRASRIISRLRDFVAKRAPQRSKVDINHIIHEAMDFMQSDPRSDRVEFQLNLGKQVQLVEADGIQIEQVIINLAKNSLEAMAENQSYRRRLMIQTVPLDAKAVRVLLKDTGSGLPDGQGNKVFDPFFTTKSGGMGMGLSISRTIVESHGGRMAVVENAGRGVTFHFTLPTEAKVMT